MSEFYIEKPADFVIKCEVSTVFMEYEKKILLLQRAPHKIAPNTWAIPGGKLEKNETPLEGLLREIMEELQLYPSALELVHLHSLFVKHLLGEYYLHLFRWKLHSLPLIILNPDEHQNFVWQPIVDFDQLPLLEGQLQAFHFAYNNYQDSPSFS